LPSTLKYDATGAGGKRHGGRQNVTIKLNQEGGKAESALSEPGLPPGFTVQTEDLTALVTRFNDVPEDYAFPRSPAFRAYGRQF